MNKIITAILLGAALLLGACGPKGPPTGPTGVANPPFLGDVPEDAMVNEGAAGTYGNTLVMAIPNNPRTFNIIKTTDTTSAGVTADIVYAALADYDNERQIDVPSLAKSWESSPDGLTWTFHLRKGVRWSDGAPFNADDVIFNYQVMFDPNIAAPPADLFTQSDGSFPTVEKVDDYTVRFRLKEPNALFVAAIGSAYLIPKHKYEAAYKAGNFDQALQTSTDPKDIVSLGPYRIVEFTPDQRLVLERNPYYWKVDQKGQRLPYIDKVIFVIVPSFDTAALKFQQGETDMIYSINPEAVEELKKNQQAQDYTIYDLGPSFLTSYLVFNQDTRRNKQGKPYVDPAKLKWFRNVKFRQAVAYAIDREAIIQTAFQGHGVPIYGFMSPANKLWHTEDKMTYPHDPEKARALLKEIGIEDRNGDGIAEDADGNPVKFSLFTNSNRAYRVNMGTLIKGDLAKVGMEVNFQPIEANLVTDKLNNTRDFEAIILGWQSGVPPDPIIFKNGLLPSASNYYAFPRQNPPSTDWEKRLQELLIANSKATSLPERQKHFYEAMRIWSEYLPEIDLVVPKAFAGAKNRFGNLKPSPLANYTYWNIEELYFTK